MKVAMIVIITILSCYGDFIINWLLDVRAVVRLRVWEGLRFQGFGPRGIGLQGPWGSAFRACAPGVTFLLSGANFRVPRFAGLSAFCAGTACQSPVLQV